MEPQKIEKLIEKYFNAETSLEEESRLRSYFSSGNVAPHLQEYTPLFGYFESSKEEKFSGRVNFKKNDIRVYSWIAVAASIVVVAGLFFHEPGKTNGFGSYEDPEIAMQKTKETLQLVSRYMKTGTEELVYLQEFDNAKNKILRK